MNMPTNARFGIAVYIASSFERSTRKSIKIDARKSAREEIVNKAAKKAVQKAMIPDVPGSTLLKLERSDKAYAYTKSEKRYQDFQS